MRPGSERTLLVLAGKDVPHADGPIRIEGPISEGSLTQANRIAGALRRYRVVALERGSATITLGDVQWKFEVRGPRLASDQTSDDTDSGWGENPSGHTRAFWEEQQPPHWS